MNLQQERWEGSKIFPVSVVGVYVVTVTMLPLDSYVAPGLSSGNCKQYIKKTKLNSFPRGDRFIRSSKRDEEAFKAFCERGLLRLE